MLRLHELADAEQAAIVAAALEGLSTVGTVAVSLSVLTLASNETLTLALTFTYPYPYP